MGVSGPIKPNPHVMSCRRIFSQYCTLLCLSSVAAMPGAVSAGESETLPDMRWHLTARPWTPVNQSKTELLDRVDAIVHAMALYQNSSTGAIIDPYKAQEWQYSTPYFTFASATALSAGRASDLITNATLAMDRATYEVANNAVPQSHGEFVAAPIMKALRLFKAMYAKGLYPAQITSARIATWNSRMSTTRATFIHSGLDINWMTYASKGEWLRQQDGLITDGTAWIETKWSEKQRSRFTRDKETYGASPYYYIYHDDTCDPETFAYNGGAAGNYLDMLENGYNGASATEMRDIVEHSTMADLLYMGASGEAPAGGRSGAHTWNDAVYGNSFEMMAEIAYRNGDLRKAGQFRRAAELAFKSAWRFQSESGWFSVTKNHFHPSLAVNYASYSALTNYNGYMEIHSSEAYASRQSSITEVPTPAEIGGYCVQLDSEYASTFLNAGGMQAQLCTRGTLTDDYSVRWHKLGIPRFSRAGWDSRLGPSDGAATWDLTQGVSFAPTFYEGGVWKNISTMPGRFIGSFTPEIVNPLLVRGVMTIAPQSGQTGPTFQMSITLTPSGALIDTARTSGTQSFGVTWPLLTYDGQTKLVTSVASQTASTSFPYVNGSYTTKQAESANVISGGITLDTNQTGYNGTSFANFPATGGLLRWTSVDGGAGGSTVIGFRYALGNTARTVRLTVNGVAQNITFDSTTAFSDWHQLYLPVTLTAGTTNTIQLESTGQDSANIDELRVYAAAASPPEMDQQNFIALQSTHVLDTTSATVRSPYGDLQPVRVTDSAGAKVETFVYPRSPGDPTAAQVRSSFTRSGNDFSTVLGQVKGSLYFADGVAGGVASAIDLNNDGANDVSFSESCSFVLQRSGTTVSAVEADRFVTMTYAGRQVRLAPYTPLTWSSTATFWNFIAVPATENRFETVINFTPTSNGVNVPVGFSAAGVSDASSLVAGLQFGADGMITPLSGAGLVNLSYQAGTSYRIRTLFDLTAHTYSLWVKPSGGTEHRLLVNAALPSVVTAVSDLSTFGWYGDASCASSATVTNYPINLDVGTMTTKVNFQDTTSAGYPGFMADIGAAYGDRGNGYSYGWIEGANTSLTRNRNSTISPDERYDTFNQMQYNSPATETHTWEIAVPNGTYNVHLACGDPSYTDSSYQVLAEGATLVQGTPSTAQYFIENTTLITVTDGRLTLTNGANAVRNKVCFIEMGLINGYTDTFPYKYYSDWASQYFSGGLSNPDAARSADPNHNGIPNEVEYALGHDPNSTAGGSTFTSFALKGGGAADFSFHCANSAIDASYHIWKSTDLVNWTQVWNSLEDADFSSPLISVSGTAADTVVTLHASATTESPKAFYRLTVDVP
jgi:Carbohydrate binding module (family 6)